MDPYRINDWRRDKLVEYEVETELFNICVIPIYFGFCRIPTSIPSSSPGNFNKSDFYEMKDNYWECLITIKSKSEDHYRLRKRKQTVTFGEHSKQEEETCDQQLIKHYKPIFRYS